MDWTLALGSRQFYRRDNSPTSKQEMSYGSRVDLEIPRGCCVNHANLFVPHCLQSREDEREKNNNKS